MTFVDFLTSSSARFIYVPIVTIFIGSFLKYFCVPEEKQRFDIEFFYWGPNLIATAILLIFVDFSTTIQNNPNQLQEYCMNLVPALIFTIICSFLMIFIIKKWGYYRHYGGPNVLVRIVIPDLIGVFMMFCIWYNLG